MEIFDEDKAVDFILKEIAEKTKNEKKYKADDILEVIDIIWDYYEDNGFLDIDMSLDEEEGDDDVDTQKLIDHVVKMLRKDKSTNVLIEDVPAIVKAELDYEKQCDSL